MADLRGARGTRAPPGGPNSFNSMQFLGKYGKIVCWPLPGELAPPPRRNPGSATAMLHDSRSTHVEGQGQGKLPVTVGLA